MNRFIAAISTIAVMGTAYLPVQPDHLAAFAQPSKGAGPALERVREVMSSRFDNLKLTGDPDKDFATLLIAHHEDLIFLAKTQLEQGGDRQMRQLAQKLIDDQQKQIDEVKQWQVRVRQPDSQAQPDQSPPGSGPPVEQKGQAVASAPAQGATAAAPPAAAAAAAAPANLPMVSATVEKVDTAGGKITLDHGPIPNLNMDGMTMVFRAQDPAMLKAVKQGDKVQFQADRVNGQITVTKIQTAGGQSTGSTQAAAPATAAPATGNLPMVSGTVEKVDTAAGKVTLDHGPIPNLNMDAMTMVFRAQDPAALKSVKAGDKVQFQADRVNGQITLIKIQKGR